MPVLDQNVETLFSPRGADVRSEYGFGTYRTDHIDSFRSSSGSTVAGARLVDSRFNVSVGEHLTLYADAVRLFNAGSHVPPRYRAGAVSLGCEILVEAIQRAEARIRFKKYVQLKGRSQMVERRDFAAWLQRTTRPTRHIRDFMRSIDEHSSETALEATIDLLSLLGTVVVELALELAFSARTLVMPLGYTVASHRMSSNALYALAIAAGRVQPTVVLTLRKSPYETFREAAAELAETLAPEAARSLLKSLSNDSSPSVASLAQSLLANLDQR